MCAVKEGDPSGAWSDVAQVPSRSAGDLRLLDVNNVSKSRSPAKRDCATRLAAVSNPRRQREGPPLGNSLTSCSEAGSHGQGIPDPRFSSMGKAHGQSLDD